MSKPKVLIHVVGGIAYWSSTADVDVIVVDEDNIKAGDDLVSLTTAWQPVVEQALGQHAAKLIRYET